MGGAGGMGLPDMGSLRQQMEAMGRQLKTHKDSNLPGQWARFDVEAYKSAYDSLMFQYMAEVMQREEAKFNAEKEGQEPPEMDPPPLDPLTDALGLLEALLNPSAENRDGPDSNGNPPTKMADKLKPYFPEHAKLPTEPLKRANLVPILEEMWSTNATPLRVTLLGVVSGSVGRWNPAKLDEIPEEAPPFHPYLYHMLQKIDPVAIIPALVALFQMRIFASELRSVRTKLARDFEILDVLCVFALNNMGMLRGYSEISRDNEGGNWISHASREVLESATRDMYNVVDALGMFASLDFEPWKAHILNSRKQDPKPKKKGDKKAEGEEKKDEEKKAGSDAEEKKEAEPDADENKETQAESKEPKGCISHYDYLLMSADAFCTDLSSRDPTIASEHRRKLEFLLLQLRMSMFDETQWMSMKEGKQGEELETLETLEKMVKRHRGPGGIDVCSFCRRDAKEGEKFKHCGRCKGAWYCSSECQREDWVEHKRECVQKEKEKEAGEGEGKKKEEGKEGEGEAGKVDVE